jgi:hypothetical protein
MDNGKTDTVIVFYSRSGHSARLARFLNNKLDSTLLEIKVPAYASGLFGYARAGYDSLRQHDTPVPQSMPSVSGFDRIILCGPVWTSFPAVPLRTFLRAGLPASKKVALFLTTGGHSPSHKAFDAAQTDLGRPLAVTGCLPNSVENTDKETDMIAGFLAELETATYATKMQ